MQARRTALSIILLASFAATQAFADDVRTKSSDSPGKIETPAKTATATKLSEKDYLGLYLTSSDLGPDLKMTQDTRKSGPDPGDTAFGKLGGQQSGFAVWTSDRMDETIWRVVDIRWVFPDAKSAAAYHKAQLETNSEGNPALQGAPEVGEECNVYGGTVKLAGTSLTHYFYLFRVDNVVAKLYVAQGPNVYKPEDALKVAMVAKIAKAIVTRISKIVKP